MIYIVPQEEAAYAKKGVINLSETDFDKNHIISLDGEWEFYWNQLMEPDDFMKDSQNQPAFMKVPGSWTHDLSGNTYMAEGYATYKLTIKDVPAKTYLGIRKQNIRSACKIFINGNLILQDGNPTNSEETVLLGNSPQIRYFETEGTTIELVIQAANYHYFVGGIGKSIVLGQQKALLEQTNKKIFFEVVIITILLVIGLIYFFLYISIDVYRKREPAIMPFALCCIFLALQSSLISERILYILFPDLSMALTLKLRYAAICLIIIFLVLMVNKVEKVLPEKLYKVIAFILGAFVLVIILFPVRIFLAFDGVLMVFSFIVQSGVSFRTFQVYLKRKKIGNIQKSDSIFVAVMFSSVVYHVAHTLYALGILKDATIAFLCIVFYSLSFVYLLFIRYSEAYKKNEEMSAKLVEAFYSLDKTTQKAQRSEIAFLQAQIKPHFLFNAMSSIISLCYTDGHRAGKILTELSKYLKDSFNIDYESDYITIESELKLVESFVKIEKERFGDRIKMEYDIDSDVLGVKIIPLVIEPLVENAIRHGILRNKKNGRAKLTIKKASEGITICVEDNGKGIEGRQIEKITQCDKVEKHILKGNGVSLININNRLKEFYNENLSFETNEEGTRVFFTIPMKGSKEDEND